MSGCRVWGRTRLLTRTNRISSLPKGFCAFLGVKITISALFSCTGWSNLPQPSLCHAALHTRCIAGVHAPRGNSSQRHCLLLWTAQGYWYGEEKKKPNAFFPEFSPLGLIFPFCNGGSSWGSVRKVSGPGFCQMGRRRVCINKGSHCLSYTLRILQSC